MGSARMELQESYKTMKPTVPQQRPCLAALPLFLLSFFWWPHWQVVWVAAVQEASWDELLRT